MNESGFLPHLINQAFVLLRKDLLLEWRSRSRMISVLLFGVTTLLLFSFGLGPDTSMLKAGAAGFLGLALLLSSTLALSESFRLEQEERALEGLLLLPVDPAAMFYGKALSNTLFLFLLGPVLMPVAFVLYTVDMGSESAFRLLGLWALAAAGLTAPGTLYAAMTSRLRSQDVLLPLLLFPLVIPVLVAAVESMGLVINGDPMEQLPSWTLMLVAFDVIYWSLCGLFFTYVVEE